MVNAETRMYEQSSQNDTSCIPSEWCLNFPPNHKKLSYLSDLNPDSMVCIQTRSRPCQFTVDWEATPHCKGLGLITGQSPRISVVDKVAMEQVCLPVLWFSPVSIVSPILHTHHHLNAILITPCK